MSTRPCCRNGSRLADTASTNSILSSATPSLPATILAISTSKPSGSPDRPLRPNSGWSNFVPTVSLPAAWISAMRLPAGKVAAGSAGAATSSPPPSLSLPQALKLMARAAERVSEHRREVRMGRVLVCLRGWRVRGGTGAGCGPVSA